MKLRSIEMLDKVHFNQLESEKNCCLMVLKQQHIVNLQLNLQLSHFSYSIELQQNGALLLDANQKSDLEQS